MCSESRILVVGFECEELDVLRHRRTPAELSEVTWNLRFAWQIVESHAIKSWFLRHLRAMKRFPGVTLAWNASPRATCGRL